MKIIITAEELLDSEIWDKFCDLRGIDKWAVNEGLMDYDEEFILSEEEAELLKLI